MRKIMRDIRSLEALLGVVWTQLTDVRQELMVFCISIGNQDSRRGFQ